MASRLRRQASDAGPYSPGSGPGAGPGPMATSGRTSASAAVIRSPTLPVPIDGYRIGHRGGTQSMTEPHWGASFDADELARLETRMWKAYYRRQPARLFGLLVQAIRAQAGVSWPRALAASLLLTRAAAGFARATGDYDRFAPDIARGYRMLKLPAHVDVEAVARHELRWWVVRREIGLAAGSAAG